MRLSIIIPTKDRGEVFDQTLRNTLDSIQHVDAEIIVVNDSKTFQPFIPDTKRIKLIKNVKSGVASARNAGVKESRGEILLFLDDDILISDTSVTHILNLHTNMPDACFNLNWEYPVSLKNDLKNLQFGRFMEAHELTSFKGWYDDASWKDNALFLSKSVASFHLSISRINFEKTSGYNELFPHAGFEDYDFPLQLKRANIALYIDSRILVFHNERDRIKMENWLNSQKRRAATRSVAVTLGYQELRLTYSLVKELLLNCIITFSRIILNLLRIIPNNRLMDPLYFKLVEALLASKIYEGYTSSNKIE